MQVGAARVMDGRAIAVIGAKEPVVLLSSFQAMQFGTRQAMAGRVIGYKRSGSSCIAVQIPRNASLNNPALVGSASLDSRSKAINVFDLVACERCGRSVW